MWGNQMQAQQHCKVDNLNMPDNEKLCLFICITFIIKPPAESRSYHFSITYIVKLPAESTHAIFSGCKSHADSLMLCEHFPLHLKYPSSSQVRA
jgi:hypothetical protein